MAYELIGEGGGHCHFQGRTRVRSSTSRQSHDDDDSARERQLAGAQAVKSRARGPTITQLRAKQAALVWVGGCLIKRTVRDWVGHLVNPPGAVLSAV